MRMNQFTVTADEYVTYDFRWPDRRVVAQLEVLSGTPAGFGSLRLVIEGHAADGEPYLEIVSTAPLAALGRVETVVLPRDEDPGAFRPPLARCRLVRDGHLAGRIPRFELNLYGL